DAWFVVACLNNRLRRLVAELLGIDDPRIAGNEWEPNSLGPEHAAEIDRQIADAFKTRPAEEWCDLLVERGVPCGLIRVPAEVFVDPHVVENEMIVELEHSVVGKIRMPNSPVRMSDAETGSRKAAPALGEDTRSFLAE